jgi:hypothetical protein
LLQETEPAATGAVRSGGDGRRSVFAVDPATATLAASLLAAAVLLLYAGRHLTFFYDEWDFVFQRRSGGLSTFLEPHNGHLVVFAVVVYRILFAIVGLRHYVYYEAVAVVLHLLSAALLYVLARRRVGAWFALVPTVLLLFMGTAWQVLLWPFQITFLTSVAGGLGALAVLDLGDRRRDPLACLLLVWSLTGSGAGLAFLAAAAILLITRSGEWRRLWIIAVPAVLFVIWYLGWAGSSEQITSDSILGSPQYVADAAAGAIGGIAGLSSTWWPGLTVGAVALLAGAWRRGRGGGPSPMLLAALAGALTFWVLAALVRSSGPDPAASRYLYIGAVFIWLIVAETLRGYPLRNSWLWLGGILAVGALVANLGALRTGERGLRASDDSVRASLGVIDIAAPVVSPGFVPESGNAPQITAGLYLAAAHALGTPALTLSELKRTPEPILSHSDKLFVLGERLALVPGSSQTVGTRPIDVMAASGGRSSAEGLCTAFAPAGGPGSLELRISPGEALSLRTAAGGQSTIYVRRLDPTYQPSPVGTIAGGGTAQLRFPMDRAPGLPWYAQVRTSARVRACVS